MMIHCRFLTRGDIVGVAIQTTLEDIGAYSSYPLIGIFRFLIIIGAIVTFIGVFAELHHTVRVALVGAAMLGISIILYTVSDRRLISQYSDSYHKYLVSIGKTNIPRVVYYSAPSMPEQNDELLREVAEFTIQKYKRDKGD